jgi:hypothetical protein
MQLSTFKLQLPFNGKSFANPINLHNPILFCNLNACIFYFYLLLFDLSWLQSFGAFADKSTNNPSLIKFVIKVHLQIIFSQENERGMFYIKHIDKEASK